MLNGEEQARVEQVVRSLWQGDLLATRVAVALEAPESTLLSGAQELEPVDEDRIWAPAALDIASGWTAIVTQTCDVVRATDDVAHMQLMPLVELSDKEWREALGGRRGTLFSLPPADGLPLARPAIDCAISFPVAKAALAHDRVRTLSTPMDPATRILLSNWLMRRVGRHAFPDELEHHVLRPLRARITRAMGKNSPSGHLSSCLIGAWSSTAWGPSVSIILVVDENRLKAQGVDLDLDKAVDELLATARKELGRKDLSVQVTATVRTLEAVSAFDLLIAHRQLDLDPLPVGVFAAAAAARRGSPAVDTQCPRRSIQQEAL